MSLTKQEMNDLAEEFLTVISKNRTSQLNEVDLFDQKWFDYRFIHPVQSTQIFAISFWKEWIRWGRLKSGENTNKDIHQTRHVRNRSHLLNLSKSLRTSFNSGRKTADSLCIPYPFYLRCALEFLCQKKQIKFSFLPKPQHVYSADVVSYVMEQWSIRLEQLVIRAEHNWYLDETNHLHLWSLQYQHWLCECVKTSSCNRAVILADLIEKKHLSQTVFRNYFDERTIRKVISHIV